MSKTPKIRQSTIDEIERLCNAQDAKADAMNDKRLDEQIVIAELMTLDHTAPGPVRETARNHLAWLTELRDLRAAIDMQKGAMTACAEEINDLTAEVATLRISSEALGEILDWCECNDGITLSALDPILERMEEELRQ